jgi:hypothetical protein
VTVAFGIAAPLGSSARPRMVPFTDCWAIAAEAAESTTAEVTSVREILDMDCLQR